MAPFPVGDTIELGDGTALQRLQATSAPARVDAYAGLEGAHPEEMLKLGMRAGVAAPILVEGRLWGAVAAGSAQAPFDAPSEHRLAAFAELVAQAIANVDAQMRLKRSSARVIEAADGARRKLERDLHDGAQQRLVTLAIGLRLLARRAGPDVAPAVEAASTNCWPRSRNCATSPADCTRRCSASTACTPRSRRSRAAHPWPRGCR